MCSMAVWVSRSGTSMATPVAAGFAALVLSHMSSRDFQLKGRGHEVKARLKYLSQISRHVPVVAGPSFGTCVYLVSVVAQSSEAATSVTNVQEPCVQGVLFLGGEQ